MPQHNAFALAVDIGGTHVRAARVSDRGQIEARSKIDTPDEGRPEAVIAAVHGLLAALLPSDRASDGVGVGVAVPGPLDPTTGVVFEPPNMLGWGTYPLAQRLADRLGRSVWIHNDADLAGLGEARHGAGSGHDPLLYLTVSTGIGGGIVQGGRIYAGAHGLAAECGHIVVQAGGPVCNAGHAGCAEALASGTAIARRAAEVLATAPGTTHLARYVTSGVSPTAEDVARAAADGDAVALGIFEAAGTALGLAIGSLINVLDPARVVLGGGLTAVWGLWAPAMHRAVASYVMAASARAIDIVPAALGDDAGLVGAAVYAFDQTRSPATNV